MEVVIAIVSALVGAVIAYFGFKKLALPEPVGFLHVRDEELFLQLTKPINESIAGKRYVVMRVNTLNPVETPDSSHK